MVRTKCLMVATIIISPNILPTPRDRSRALSREEFIFFSTDTHYVIVSFTSLYSCQRKQNEEFTIFSRRGDAICFLLQALTKLCNVLLAFDGRM